MVAACGLLVLLLHRLAGLKVRSCRFVVCLESRLRCLLILFDECVERSRRILGQRATVVVNRGCRFERAVHLVLLFPLILAVLKVLLVDGHIVAHLFHFLDVLFFLGELLGPAFRLFERHLHRALLVFGQDFRELEVKALFEQFDSCLAVFLGQNTQGSHDVVVVDEDLRMVCREQQHAALVVRRDLLHDLHAVRQARQRAAGADDVLDLGEVLTFNNGRTAGRSVDVADDAGVAFDRLEGRFFGQ